MKKESDPIFANVSAFIVIIASLEIIQKRDINFVRVFKEYGGLSTTINHNEDNYNFEYIIDTEDVAET